MNPERLGAVVLAGGRSRRMGCDKAALQIDQETLLHRVCRVLREVCDQVVVVTAGDRSLPSLDELAVRVDEPPELAGQGPLVALSLGLAALERMDCVHAYVSAVDVPGLSSRHVLALRRALERGAQSQSHGEAGFERRPLAAVPIDEAGRLHPLASLVEVATLGPWVRERVAAGERSPTRLFESVPIVRVARDELPDPAILEPCNTREEWARQLRFS